MPKSVSFENRDKFIQIGIVISTLRKFRGMSQTDLASKVGIARNTLGAIESPNVIRSFSMETLLKISYALDVGAETLINASLFPDSVLNK